MPLCCVLCAGAWSRWHQIPKDHEAFIEIRKAVPILARHASFLGRCLLALSFFQPAGLSQEVLDELIVLVEVLDTHHGWCMGYP